MIKKIALFAFAMSAAFSNAFAADCEIDFSGATTFTGNQIKPTVTKVVCGTDEYTDIDESQITYGENINAGKDAGSITVALSSTLSAETKFTIKQKSIYIQTENCEKEMGASDPEFKWHMLEVQNLNKDTLANLQTRLESLIELTRAEGESILGSNQELMHYDITFANGVDALLAKELPNYRVCLYDEIGYLTISKMKVHVVVLGSSKTYGTKDPKIEYSLRSNFETLNLDEIGKIKLIRDEGENVGGYTVNVTIDGKQYRDQKNTETGCEPEYCKETDNYYVYIVTGMFGITATDVTVAVDDVSKTYGNTTPEFTYKVSGLVGEDVLKDVTLACAKCSSTGLENVGEYAISASVNAVSNPNYNVTTTNGTLTVKPKAATVTLDNAEKVYGDKDPKFTYTTEGLVKGQSLEGVAITRDEGEKVGTYKVNIDFAEGSNPNYTLTTVPSTLTVTPKTVTLNVTNITKKYGEKDPELVYTVDGIVKFGNEEDVLKGVSLMREPGENSGEYAITATVDAEANPNYIVNTTDGKLTITANNDKIVVTIKGHSETVQYNGEEHVVKGFDISTNSEAYSLKFVEYIGDSIVTGKDAGKYAMGLTASAFKNTSVNYPNVTFNITDGVLQIDPRKLVVTALPDTITYGDEIPTDFTWSADSLLEKDELDNIHVTLNKTGRLDAGDYALTFDQKNPTNKNYTVTKYVANFLTVRKKVVTVTVADTSKFYSEADPEKYEYKVEGLLDGDVLPELVLKRQAGENVLPDDETYAISAAFAKGEPSSNYAVKIHQGNFIIKPCSQRITVAIYGETVTAKYQEGEEITIQKSFDVSPMRIPGEPWLPEEFAYRKEFVTYKGEMSMTEKDLGEYSMGLVATDFVNASPNFDNVNFVVILEGTFKITDQETSIARVKDVKPFGLSSMNRQIQVNGATAGKRFAVIDMKGKVVRQGVVDSPNFEIPVSNAGIYMVRIGASAQRIRIK